MVNPNRRLTARQASKSSWLQTNNNDNNTTDNNSYNMEILENFNNDNSKTIMDNIETKDFKQLNFINVINGPAVPNINNNLYSNRINKKRKQINNTKSSNTNNKAQQIDKFFNVLK